MAGMKIDPDGVTSYAKTMTKGADQLGSAADALKGDTLGVEAFGELGRQVRTAEAYSRAASALCDQLDRAVESLHAASDSLTEVAERYLTGERDAVQQIKRSEQPR
ncbi:hypothetical protein JOF56_002887 [Kibdelosporangium banguiense]|uniref:Excreted virulence factor EspC, type VII ESX diderm n=1 Tax=Kibdelosporangium banguiense TaxID=1365924 RepID=A0ABS4TDK0_9PSEU|nr:hypothetical protein [Kibdelosporangium banguiense]MBP2322502.1 hypothetical protein [Kibdelosporangium banguiense]